MKRRTFLKIAGCGVASSLVSSPLVRALADDAHAPNREGQFFVFIHASGGWDVTLWADPRNEKTGLIAPASTANTARWAPDVSTAAQSKTSVRNANKASAA